MINANEVRQIVEAYKQKTDKDKRIDEALARIEKKIKEVASKGRDHIFIIVPSDVSEEVVSKLQGSGYNVEKVDTGPEHRVSW